MPRYFAPHFWSSMLASCDAWGIGVSGKPLTVKNEHSNFFPCPVRAPFERAAWDFRQIPWIVLQRVSLFCLRDLRRRRRFNEIAITEFMIDRVALSFRLETGPHHYKSLLPRRTQRSAAACADCGGGVIPRTAAAPRTSTPSASSRVTLCPSLKIYFTPLSDPLRSLGMKMKRLKKAKANIADTSVTFKSNASPYSV